MLPARAAHRKLLRSATIDAVTPASTERRRISERTLIKALQVDRLELYLLMAALRVGRYDSVTHLLYFTVEEAERIAAELGHAPQDWNAL